MNGGKQKTPLICILLGLGGEKCETYGRRRIFASRSEGAKASRQEDVKIFGKADGLRLNGEGRKSETDRRK